MPRADGVDLYVPHTAMSLGLKRPFPEYAPALRSLLRGLDTCLRAGIPQDVWLGHLERVAGNGARAHAQRADKGSLDAPRLPDTLDPPLPPETIPLDEPLAIDVETWTKDPPWVPGAKLISVGFSACQRRWAYLATYREEIQSYLRLPHVKIFHNSSFDIAYLLWAGFGVAE
jgi:hypothetical protein